MEFIEVDWQNELPAKGDIIALKEFVEMDENGKSNYFVIYIDERHYDKPGKLIAYKKIGEGWRMANDKLKTFLDNQEERYIIASNKIWRKSGDRVYVCYMTEKHQEPAETYLDNSKLIDSY
jgi:hypothetical protein